MYINEKMIPVETYKNQWKGDEEEWGRGWIQVWYVWYITRTFVIATMYPHQAEQ
jgi:hypothetical protein